MTFLRVLWALPVSLLAVPFSLYAWPMGLRVVGGCLELTVVRLWPGMGATTLGHVILYRRDQDPAHHRAHEHVHVSQCERWGFLMPLLYVLASAWAVYQAVMVIAYSDNHFERQARERSK